MNFLQSRMYKAAALTFEELGFMFPVPEEETTPPAGEPDISVAVRFSGEFEGLLMIRAYDGLAGALAANMLGEFEAPSQQMQADALGEMANVICGNLLPEIAGHEKTFDLASPQAVEAPDTPPMPQAGAVNIALDQGHAQLVLFAESGAALAAGAQPADSLS